MKNDEQQRVEKIRKNTLLGRTYLQSLSDKYRTPVETYEKIEAENQISDILFLLDLVKRQQAIINMYESDPMSEIIRFRHDNPPETYKTDKERQCEEELRRAGLKVDTQ